MLEMFETDAGHPVRAELVEAIKRGGRRCHRVIQVCSSAGLGGLL